MIRKTHNPLLAQFLRFSGVGVIGTAAHYLTLITLVELGSINTVVASSCGAIVGALVNYILNYHYTFRSDKRHHEAMVKFFVIAGIGFVCNGLLMALLAEYLGINYLIAQVITTGIVLLWNFIGNRLWTFRDAERKSETI